MHLGDHTKLGVHTASPTFYLLKLLKFLTFSEVQITISYRITKYNSHTMPIANVWYVSDIIFRIRFIDPTLYASSIYILRNERGMELPGITQKTGFLNFNYLCCKFQSKSSLFSLFFSSNWYCILIYLFYCLMIQFYKLWNFPFPLYKFSH